MLHGTGVKYSQKSGNQSGFGDKSGSLQLRIVLLRNKFCILFSEILHVPDLWIFRALKIRPQIGLCPEIGCPQIG